MSITSTDGSITRYCDKQEHPAKIPMLARDLDPEQDHWRWFSNDVACLQGHDRVHVGRACEAVIR